MIEVKNFQLQKTNLIEAYQKLGVLFAFVSSKGDGYRMCHQWVKCKDYLHDAVRTQLTGKESRIYGFKYTKDENPPIDLNKMRMALTKDYLTTDTAFTNFKEDMEYSVKLLNHFEDIARVVRTTIQEVSIPGNKNPRAFMFESSRMWLTSPTLISMYTMLVRLGVKRIEFEDEKDLKAKFKEMADGKWQGGHDNDTKLLKACHDRLHKILRKRLDLFKPTRKRINLSDKLKNIAKGEIVDGFSYMYFEGTPINDFHNRAGIFGASQGQSYCNTLNDDVKELFAK